MLNPKLKKLYAILIFQIILIAWGIADLFTGWIIIGWIQITTNFILLLVNLRIIRRQKLLNKKSNHGKN